jgi:hypothetical protein
MNKQLQEMLAKSTFTISSENYIYAKVSKIPPLQNHFLVSHDSDEITVVTKETNLEELDIIERNDNKWRLVSLNLYTPFMAGTLAVINSACAEKGLNNLVGSTYSKDYLFIKESQIEQINEVLISLGFKHK